MRVGTKTSIQFEAVCHLNEPEMRALDALVGYGIDPFIKAFYDTLGKSYMQEHEAGLRSLFEAINAQVRPELARVDEVKKVLKYEMVSGGKLA